MAATNERLIEIFEGLKAQEMRVWELKQKVIQAQSDADRAAQEWSDAREAATNLWDEFRKCVFVRGEG